MLDLTEPFYQLLATIISILIPVLVAWVSLWAKRALAALEVQKYAAALKEYDATLYEAVVDAGEAAAAKLLDVGQNFGQKDVRPYIENTALEVIRAFEERAGVRVEYSSERLDDLIELATARAKEEWRRQRA